MCLCKKKYVYVQEAKRKFKWFVFPQVYPLNKIVTSQSDCFKTKIYEKT